MRCPRRTWFAIHCRIRLLHEALDGVPLHLIVLKVEFIIIVIAAFGVIVESTRYAGWTTAVETNEGRPVVGVVVG